MKKRGPIIAEIKKNNLIDLYLRQLKHTTNPRFVKNLFTHVFTANRHGSPNKRAHDLIAAR